MKSIAVVSLSFALVGAGCTQPGVSAATSPAIATVPIPAGPRPMPPSPAPAEALTSPATAAGDYSNLYKDFVYEWTVEDLFRRGNLALNAGGRSFERADKIWQTVSCTLCHHFNGGSGGIGPDLTGASAKFDVPALLREIIEPSETISSIYSTQAVTTTDGRRYVGRPAGQNAETFDMILTWSPDPSTGAAEWNGPMRKIPNDTITSVEESGVSPMPPGQLNNLHEDEIFDLLAFIISGGNKSDKMFQKK